MCNTIPPSSFGTRPAARKFVPDMPGDHQLPPVRLLSPSTARKPAHGGYPGQVSRGGETCEMRRARGYGVEDFPPAARAYNDPVAHAQALATWRRRQQERERQSRGRAWPQG